jgi:uncharacterized protein DUF4189
MKKLLITLASILPLLYALDVSAIGALAIDNNKGSRYGFSYDYSTESDAQARALRECGDGCKIVKTFSSGCAAYAADQASGSPVYGWGVGSNSDDAQSIALEHCQILGGTQCIIRVWGCNSK